PLPERVPRHRVIGRAGEEEPGLRRREADERGAERRRELLEEDEPRRYGESEERGGAVHEAANRIVEGTEREAERGLGGGQETPCDGANLKRAGRLGYMAR